MSYPARICIYVDQHQMVNSYAKDEVRGPRLENFQYEKQVNARLWEQMIEFELLSKDIVEI